MKQIAAKGVLWTGIAQFSSLGLTFIITVILARLLAPEAFGIVAMAAVVIGIGEIFQNFGLGGAIIQKPEFDMEDLSTVFWLNVAAGLVLTMLTCFSAPLIAVFYHKPEVIPVLRALSILFLIGAFLPAQAALLYRRLDFRSLAMRKIIGAVAGAIVGVTMALSGYGVWSLVGQALAQSAAGAVVIWILSRWVPEFKFDYNRLVDLWSFSVRLTGTNILKNLGRIGDRMLVGRYLGATSLGYYQIAANWMMLPQVLTNEILGQVAFPALSRIQQDLEKVKQAFLFATKVVALLVLPGMAGLAVIAPELVLVIYGSKWMPSVVIVQFLAIVGARQAILVMSGTVFQALGLVGFQMKWELISLLAMLAAVVVGAPYGLNVVAGFIAASSLLTAPIGVIGLCKALKMPGRTWLKVLLIPALIGAVVAACMLATRVTLNNAGFGKTPVLMATMLIGIITYFGLIFAISRGDVMDLIGMFRGKTQQNEKSEQ